MMRDISRRRFLLGATGAGIAGALVTLRHVPRVSAEDGSVTPEMVRFTPEIEPLVRLIEKTPREDAVRVLAARVRDGLPYKDFLAALFLAGLRNVNPQPPGFKFHCVFMIHSTNYLAQMGPPEEKILPLFYALDDFKKAQEEDIRQGDFVLREQPGPLPSAREAWDELRAAMDDWDEERADRAITALARAYPIRDVFEGIWEYGARDYRNIGHKIIFVSNALRTLATIGWQHGEATLRSMMLGLLDFGKDQVVNDYAFEDQTYRFNEELLDRNHGSLRAKWIGPMANPAVTEEIVSALREGDERGACRLALMRLTRGDCQSQAVWDAVHLAAGELMMRQPGIAGVHTVTSANAMHYAFRACRDDRLKAMLVLQGVGWMGQFCRFMQPRTTLSILELPPVDIATNREDATAQILDSIARRQGEAAQQALAFGQRFGEPAQLFDAARQLVVLKSREHHQYKWPAAIFEDYHLVSPAYRPFMLATSVYYLRGTGHRDSEVIEEALEALKPA